MAFLDPAYPEAAVLGTGRLPASRRLAAIDRRVIVASRRDPLASLAPPRGIVRIAARLAGSRGAIPLADPALEALRRYAVLLRHGGDAMAGEAARALIAVGYGVDQVAHARWLVARETPTPIASLLVPAMLLATMLSLATWFGLAAGDVTGDPAIGLVIALFAIVSAAPLLARGPMPAGVRRA